MSNLLQFSTSLNYTGQIREARVLNVSEGESVEVQLVDTKQSVECKVLQTSTTGLTLSEGDDVLVWLRNESGSTGVVLGRTGHYIEATNVVVSNEEFSARPQTLLLESQGDLVLRNGQAKIKMGEKGDIEIVCESFKTRSRRLLRLLAPMIKFN
jgi:hypothetical protein